METTYYLLAASKCKHKRMWLSMVKYMNPVQLNIHFQAMQDVKD